MCQYLQYNSINLLLPYSDHLAGDGIRKQAGDGWAPAQGIRFLKIVLLAQDIGFPKYSQFSFTRIYFHLLKDIVESSEKPSLSSQDPAYDQFGFRQEELNNPETLEEKAEKLRRMTQVPVMSSVSGN